MMEATHNAESIADRAIAPEARYAYYRRCQEFRRNGEQCKAPAEKGSAICHAHAGQRALAVRRDQARRTVLAEAVAEMRRRGSSTYEEKDLFMGFNGIQITLAVMMRALIAGRIDCKTAGRLGWQVQMAAKILRFYHGRHRGARRKKSCNRKAANGHRVELSKARREELQPAMKHKQEPILPQICAEKRRSKDEERLQRPRMAEIVAMNRSAKTQVGAKWWWNSPVPVLRAA